VSVINQQPFSPTETTAAINSDLPLLLLLLLLLPPPPPPAQHILLLDPARCPVFSNSHAMTNCVQEMVPATSNYEHWSMSYFIQPSIKCCILPNHADPAMGNQLSATNKSTGQDVSLLPFKSQFSWQALNLYVSARLCSFDARATGTPQ
jgi:hypothetical protein